MKNNTATKKKYDVKKEQSVIVKNIKLEGLVLKADQVTSTLEVTRELHPKTNNPMKVVSKKLLNEMVEPMEFQLKEITREELIKYRREGISSFLLKLDGKLYYTSIPDNISFVSSTILGPHKCALAGHECNRLSAASDEDGGCAKVRDRAKCIERYPWITTGYETFCTKHDSFVVVECSHYEKCPPRKKMSASESNRAKLGLAQFLWEDVTSREEVKRRMRLN